MKNTADVKEKARDEQECSLLRRSAEIRKKSEKAFWEGDMERVAQFDKEDEDITSQLIALDYDTAAEIEDIAYDAFERWGKSAAEGYIKAANWKRKQEKALKSAA